MRIIIFANGIMDHPRADAIRWIGPGDVIVAANGGTRHALDAEVIPQHIIGDLDSLEPELQAQLRASGTVFQTHPPAKDETDLELALLWAAEQPAETIVVLGALGGRPDQALANLLLLALPALEGREVILAGGAWTISCIRGGETRVLHGSPGDTISLIPLGGDVHGVSTTGLAYPLRDETLHFGQARGVSNELACEEATVTTREGLLWCLRDELKLKKRESNGS
ncbi:MAG: thiamine diphosphokinase [Anaerolineae bacterium]|nr:thiamine diphosphokinase [Anaerolineae bacterium]